MTQTTITIDTQGPGLYEFTGQVETFLSNLFEAENYLGSREGLLTLFCQHTSASLIIQENADPDVQRDMNEFFRRLVPPSDDPAMGWITHTMEGADDMPAHIKAALTQTSMGIPVTGGRMALGTWQGIYLFEHRRAAHRRRIIALYTQS